LFNIHKFNTQPFKKDKIPLTQTSEKHFNNCHGFKGEKSDKGNVFGKDFKATYEIFTHPFALSNFLLPNFCLPKNFFHPTF